MHAGQLQSLQVKELQKNQSDIHLVNEFILISY